MFNKHNLVICERVTVWPYERVQQNIEYLIRRTDNIQAKLNELDSKMSVRTNGDDCTASNDWIGCKTFVNYKTNERQVIAIPKSKDEKLATWDEAVRICKS